MPLSPYIAFSGNCAAAIAFYQQALGAELLHKITWGEMPRDIHDAEDGCPSGQHLAADGGQIEMVWQETFWAHGFGKVIDRFGVPWMVNVVKEP